MSKSTFAVPAFGAILSICTDFNGSNPTVIAELGNFTLKLTTTMQESTTHRTGAPFRTYIATLHNHTTELECNFVGTDITHSGTQSTGLLYVQLQREERSFYMTPSDGSPSYLFNALVADHSIGHPVDGIRKSQITLQGTGEFDPDA